ncbi:30S ribosomal protein S2 [Nanoarchaeota archaeon NZ13-N]|nr:MAG: 30S ribosomal protein S2 [Nanoarchaeota archaeon NZ13-N]
MEWLVPLEEYIKAGVHIGTRIKTRDMKKYIAKVRRDGLAIIDINKTDERLRMVTRFLSRYEPLEILVVGRRETSKRPLQMLNKYTGIITHPGRYPPGLLTNISLSNFSDVEVVVVTDPILDKNALIDAYRTGKIIIGLVDTNNTLRYIDLAIPCNNRGAKSLALIYYLITREYLRNRGVIPKKGELDVGYIAFAETEKEEEEI